MLGAKEEAVARVSGFIGASAVGAGLMYLFDPQRGRRRRARLRDRALSATHEMGEDATATARHLGHRARGQVARVRSLILGRRRAGRATATSLWARTVARVGGVTLATTALRSGRGAVGTLLGLAGLRVMARRSGVKRALKRLPGLGPGPRATTVRRALTVNAPVDRVFEAWTCYENFPQFMSHVREVQGRAGGRSRWVLTGPGGFPVEWETEVTAQVPDQVVAWRTVPGSPVDHAGIVRFDPVPGGTRIEIRITYDPPGGALGHAVATLFGGDAERAMDEDLRRFAALLDDGQTVGRQDLAG
jgi:uncharacterized membrane protein